MKNIHILPTDKPSRLFIIDKSKMFLSEPPHLSFSTVGGKVHKIEGSELYQPQNIYITSDEEIKEGDWRITKFGDILKVGKPEKGYEPTGKKIILTTDQDLIKDGVQSIDDEFLEWFVKNPSCEVVEVELKPMFSMYKTFKEDINTPPFYGNLKYKIIIPKEEAKQETLEEFANNYSSNELSKLGFINGAKWQAERMYSEEDLRKAYNDGIANLDYDERYGFSTKITEQQWFEQFKKK